MTFAQTQVRDVSMLVGIARDKGWTVADGLGSADLRNAFAHRDFQVVGDKVLLAPRGNAARGRPVPELSLGELQDVVLQLVECVAAMELALIVTAEALDESDRLKPSGSFLARSLLVGLGWEDVRVSVAGGVGTVNATVEGPASLGAIAVAAAPLRSSVSIVRGQLKRAETGFTASFEVPMESFVHWSDSPEGLDKEAAFVVLGARTLSNGVPLLSTLQAEKLIAHAACQLTVDQGRTAAMARRDLSVWRRAAANLGLARVEKLVAKASRWRTYVDADITVDASEMAELVAMAEMPVPIVDMYLV